MKSAEKARSNGLYRHIRTSKEIIRNLLNDYQKSKINDNRSMIHTINDLGFYSGVILMRKKQH